MCILPPGNPARYWVDVLTAGLLTRGLAQNVPSRSPSGWRRKAAGTSCKPLTVAGAVTALAPIGSSAPCSLLIPWSLSVGEPSRLRYASSKLPVKMLCHRAGSPQVTPCQHWRRACRRPPPVGGHRPGRQWRDRAATGRLAVPDEPFHGVLQAVNGPRLGVGRQPCVQGSHNVLPRILRPQAAHDREPGPGRRVDPLEVGLVALSGELPNGVGIPGPQTWVAPVASISAGLSPFF